MPPFVLRHLAAGQRHLITLPATAAAPAVEWSEALKRTGRSEEYRLGPATLEDVYVELVGRADALANGNGNGAGAGAHQSAMAGTEADHAAAS
jgi:ABC-2 type transport system ATP-binding protein